MANDLLLSTLAWLWDGRLQLSGRLFLFEDRLDFSPDHFRDGYLMLSIPLSEIEAVEEFLLFDLARNGLSIRCRDAEGTRKEDRFVLEEPEKLKRAVVRLLDGC